MLIEPGFTRLCSHAAIQAQRERVRAFVQLLDPKDLMPGHTVADLYSLRHLSFQGASPSPADRVSSWAPRQFRCRARPVALPQSRRPADRASCVLVLTSSRFSEPSQACLIAHHGFARKRGRCFWAICPQKKRNGKRCLASEGGSTM